MFSALKLDYFQLDAVLLGGLHRVVADAALIHVHQCGELARQFLQRPNRGRRHREQLARGALAAIEVFEHRLRLCPS